MTDIEVDRIVKIHGTDYDRRRKLSVKDVAAIKREYKRGKSISYLANKYHVSYPAIKYHVAENYKETHNNYRKNFKFAECDQRALLKSRVALKRRLMAEGIV